MEKQSAYENLAKWFEYLNDDCGYTQWSQYFVDKLSKYPFTTGLDVGCGGGYFTRAFARAGYKMTGMDISAPMLDKAQETAMREGVRGEYLLGDIARTKLPRRFDFVTAINDCINYIPKDKLRSALKNIAGALKKDGLFLFDGSGLSPKNAISPQFFAKLLCQMSKSKEYDNFYMSLPIAGKSGTVSSFLLGSSLAGGVHLKSGSFGQVQCYAGYLSKKYAFAVMVNNFYCSRRKVLREIEYFLEQAVL